MSKSKVRITPNPAANTKVYETGQTAGNKQRAAVSGVKSNLNKFKWRCYLTKTTLFGWVVVYYWLP